MLLALTMIGAVAAGWLVADRLWRRAEAMPPLERTACAMAIGIGLWLAIDWLLALTHLLRREVLVARTIVFALAVAALVPRVWRAIRARSDAQLERDTVLLTLAFTPVALWLAFVLWRDVLVPPLNHDALAYHLPKAVLFARAEGYRSLQELNFFIPPRASNYELLLADALVLQRGDELTEWPSALFYVAFVVIGAAIVRRWFGTRRLATGAAALLIAGTPVLLLHTGAHKNDLLFAVFAIAAMLFTGRWLSEREPQALALATAALVATAGTKTHGAFLVVAFLPLLVAPLLRPIRGRAIAMAAVAGVASVVFLGGFDQLEALRQKYATASTTTISLAETAASEYGDWQNLWQAPYILLTAPFSTNSLGLAVPWAERPWFWRRGELFFSHMGVPFAIAALALPFIMVMLRKRAGPARERLAVTIATLVAFAMLLPVHFSPAGLLAIYLPRFVLYLLPVVFAWVAPLFDSSRRVAVVTVVGASLAFTAYAIDAATADSFVPPRFVSWAMAHPGTRDVPFDSTRASLVVDRRAGPRDRIAFDPGSGAWIYPAYGRELQREVMFIAPGPGAPRIPDADWVIVDRLWRAVWRNPNLRSLGDAGSYLGVPQPQAEDVRVLEALLHDPRYEPVRIDSRTMQAIFRRKR